MTIELIEDKEIWDKFVDQSSDGLLFHKWNSLKIMERYTNCKLLPYGIYDGGELICIFPLFFRKFKGLKTVFSPPPGTGVTRLGFVMNKKFDTLKQSKKEAYLNIVIEDLDKEIKKISPNYVYFSLVQNFLDVRWFEWNGYNVRANFTYVTDLNLPLDTIWNGLSRSLRNNIKEVDGSNLKLLQNNDISMFYELEKERYEKKGLNSPVADKNYLEDLFEAYPECLKLDCLYDSNNDIMGMQINCEYKDMFTQWMGGVKPKENTHYNEYMKWEFIKQAKNNGLKKMDWGGGPKNICQFKSRFSPELRIYFDISKKDNIGKFAEWIYLSFLQRIHRY
jgi:lipid II:glycine glycyltransferase (peptidoglycan interpeptide bridge formation enzyme)